MTCQSLRDHIIAIHNQQDVKQWNYHSRTFQIEGYPEVILQMEKDWDDDRDILVSRLVLQQEATPERQEQVGWECACYAGSRIEEMICESKAYVKRMRMGIRQWNVAIQTLDGKHLWIALLSGTIYVWGAGIP
jgi:hypothetical protein